MKPLLSKVIFSVNVRQNHHKNYSSDSQVCSWLRQDQQNKLCQTYRDTIQYFRYFSRKNLPRSILYNVTDDLNISDSINDTSDDLSHVTTQEVCNEDTLDMALRYSAFSKGPNDILVLNMASKWKPGGGVRTGKTAQEEDIFRRTNAFMTHPEQWYPLDDESVIYSPEVHIVRDSSYNYLQEKHCAKVSMLAVHAIKNPRIMKSAFTTKYVAGEDYELMTAKIESIFKIAILHGKRTLILGALGCGAYNNPIDEIISIFQKAIAKYGIYFDHIGFAVLAQGTKGQENFNKFYTAFGATHG